MFFYLHILSRSISDHHLRCWVGEERREAGVGFAIKTELVGKLSGLQKGIHGRLMTLRLRAKGEVMAM